jgi:hypothetical protein
LLTAALVFASGTGAAARAATLSTCASSHYAYAGVQSLRRGFGARADVSALTIPAVASGHVAAWVGVGDPHAGPNGSAEWLQVGIAAFGEGKLNLYYEVAVPAQPARYTKLATDLPFGRPFRLAVLEMAGRPNRWRVWVDGQPRSRPIYLPGSHHRWQPMATSETWLPGSSPCNEFQFRFGSVAIAGQPGGSWLKLGDHYEFGDSGYQVSPLARASFVAAWAPAAHALRRLVRVGG